MPGTVPSQPTAAPLRRMARYLGGGRDDGYNLGHSRIRDFIADAMRDEIDVYRRKVTEFCLHWDAADRSEDSVRYALVNGVAQLVDANRGLEIDSLLTPEWIAANWRYLGCTRGLGKDARSKQPNRSIKEVFGYPLTPRFRELLSGEGA